MRDRREQAEIVFVLGAISDLEAFDLIIGVAEALGLVKDRSNSGLDRQRDIIAREGEWATEIALDGVLCRFGVVSAWRHSFILIRESRAGAAVIWDRWIQAFATNSGFVQAWVSDVEYDYWQNVEDPTEYEIAGRDHSVLPKVASGLPPPLDQDMIDISRNPGRRILRDGYVEAVGGCMWLGAPFWLRTGRDRERFLKDARSLALVELSQGVVFIRCGSGAFDEHSPREAQDDLRRIVYGSTISSVVT